jgi:RNA polymerase sigma-70 factor (ECF subfamily)
VEHEFIVKPPLVAGAPDDLVVRLRRGDRQVLEMIYRQNHERVRAFARRLVGDDDVAEDLVHDVFISAPSALLRYRGDASIGTFLLSVAANKSRHFVRAASRRRRVLQRFSNEPQTRDVPAPDRTWERRELALTLLRALDKLPLQERLVFVLCEVEERTSGEAARILDAHEVTVRTRLLRAKKKLRSLLRREP